MVASYVRTKTFTHPDLLDESGFAPSHLWCKRQPPGAITYELSLLLSQDSVMDDSDVPPVNYVCTTFVAIESTYQYR